MRSESGLGHDRGNPSAETEGHSSKHPGNQDLPTGDELRVAWTEDLFLQGQRLAEVLHAQVAVVQSLSAVLRPPRIASQLRPPCRSNTCGLSRIASVVAPPPDAWPLAAACAALFRWLPSAFGGAPVSAPRHHSGAARHCGERAGHDHPRRTTSTSLAPSSGIAAGLGPSGRCRGCISGLACIGAGMLFRRLSLASLEDLFRQISRAR